MNWFISTDRLSADQINFIDCKLPTDSWKILLKDIPNNGAIGLVIHFVRNRFIFQDIKFVQILIKQSYQYGILTSGMEMSGIDYQNIFITTDIDKLQISNKADLTVVFNSELYTNDSLERISTFSDKTLFIHDGFQPLNEFEKELKVYEINVNNHLQFGSIDLINSLIYDRPRFEKNISKVGNSIKINKFSISELELLWVFAELKKFLKNEMTCCIYFDNHNDLFDFTVSILKRMNDKTEGLDRHELIKELDELTIFSIPSFNSDINLEKVLLLTKEEYGWFRTDSSFFIRMHRNQFTHTYFCNCLTTSQNFTFISFSGKPNDMLAQIIDNTKIEVNVSPENSYIDDEIRSSVLTIAGKEKFNRSAFDFDF